MSNPYSVRFDCEVCGSAESEIIPALLEYQSTPPFHICKNCGLVYVRDRRTSKEIADSWSNEIFGSGYTALIPAVRARQVYVADTIHANIDLSGKSVCDIGGGEGQFLKIIQGEDYGAGEVFAIEPSENNCKIMDGLGIENFCGTIEEFAASETRDDRKFDVVTIMWTLEACQSANAMMKAAYDIVADDGYVFVATGSRLMVPFKKPMRYFIGTGILGDTHPYHFSANTLRGLMAVCNFQPEHINRYFDTDYLVVGGRKTDGTEDISWEKDDYQAVIYFLGRWAKDTAEHFSHY
jgi:hypothetical protein